MASYKKNLKRYKTIFVPVDSEHFSIFYALQGNKISNIDKIYLTASGGPLNNVSKTKFKNIFFNLKISWTHVVGAQNMKCPE